MEGNGFEGAAHLSELRKTRLPTNRAVIERRGCHRLAAILRVRRR